MEYQPIESYGVVGNMRSAALVGLAGSIDFLCFPQFDSPTVFAALLDVEKGGHFLIEPVLAGRSARQLYVPDTNVLLTRFQSDEGMVEILDLMPVLEGDACNQVIRRVSALRGEVECRMECRPRFDYARRPHRAERCADGAIFRVDEDGIAPMMLQATVEMKLDGSDAVGTFRLKQGEVAFFSFGEIGEGETGRIDADVLQDRCDQTCAFWRGWVAKGKFPERWREVVSRSALVLKLMTDERYGSIVAAPTFGLPEKIGGERNWDYRYTWLRDSSFTLYAFMRMGFTEEGEQFHAWLRKLVNYDAQNGPLQVLYGVDGSREVPESELTHLRGYRDSRPVRIGNAAAGQLQLDIYGELMDAAYLSSKYGDGVSIEQWNNMKRVARWLEKNWRRPDSGIWEVRGGEKKFLHSRLMCWAAIDRILRLGAKRSLAGPFDWMERLRDDIVEDIHANFWNETMQAFVQYEGSETMDASVLLMPLMRFISPTDPKWLSTLAAVEKELVVDAFVLRYSTSEGIDGLAGDEGSFNPCSFWYIEALARSHQLEKARMLFEKMLTYANHLGLYSEELGRSGEHLGNYPQALTHLALVSAASFLDRALTGDGPKEWR